MNENCGVYCFENLINGKKYIGESENIKIRYRHHMYAYKNMNDNNYYSLLYTDMRKFGVDNFHFYILENCDKSELLNRESYYIEKYNTIKNGYNSVMLKNGHIERYDKYSSETIEQIQKYLLQNMSVTNVSKTLHVPRTTVSMINNGNMHFDAMLSYPLYKYAYDLKNNFSFCCDCGVKISAKSLRCKKCDILYRKNKPLDVISKEELQFLIDDGLNYTQIGRKYNVTGNSVKKWCKKYNLQIKTNHVFKPDKNTLIQLLNEKSVSHIAELYNVNKSTIHDWMKKYGLKLLSANRVLCVETNIVYNTKQEAAKDMFPNINPKDSANNISKAAKNNKTYKGYHWTLLPQEVIAE